MLHGAQHLLMHLHELGESRHDDFEAIRKAKVSSRSDSQSDGPMAKFFTPSHDATAFLVP